MNANKLRQIVQAIFLFLCIWIGVEFHLFVNFLESADIEKFHQRPPGAEGFLPVSSLMSLQYFFMTGDIHPVHPAGLVIFLSILIMSLYFGKSFCSWVCPIGALSDWLAKLGEKITGRKIKMPVWLDLPFRSLKYLILFFFAWSIFAMSASALKGFLDTQYNLMADVKMYVFFAELSKTAGIILIVLAFLSIWFRGFWCRYLCPYGALLGFFTLLSPNKIRREASSCTNCGECTIACPAFIKVEKKSSVISDECFACMACVEACPVGDTLRMENLLSKKKQSATKVAAVVLSVFILFTGLARIAGYWHNSVPMEEYIRLYPIIDSLTH